MASLHEQIFAQYGAPQLLAVHGESVVYTPKGGAPRTITAIVDRNPLEKVVASAPGAAPRLVVKVLNSATTGIDATVDVRGDTLTLAMIEGGAAEARPITKLLGQAGGMLLLEVR